MQGVELIHLTTLKKCTMYFPLQSKLSSHKRKCKVCDQVFKAKAPLLAHIGCKHGKVNDILREKGYNVLPCLLATNGKSGEEMQANLVQIKKEKAKIFAE